MTQINASFKMGGKMKLIISHLVCFGMEKEKKSSHLCSIYFLILIFNDRQIEFPLPRATSAVAESNANNHPLSIVSFNAQTQFTCIL